MFDHIIEFIQNSVTTVVGFTVGVLGIGAGDFNSQDTSLSAKDVEISESLSEDFDIFSMFDSDSQTANISGVVEGEIRDDGEAVVPTDIETESVTPLVSVVPILVQETELTRAINPIKSTRKTKEVDVSLILKTDFDKFDFNLQITEITDDDDSFYGTYQFRSLAIKNKVWQIVTKEKQIIVTKVVLGDQDLGDYLSEELGEVIDNEVVFLKEVQEIQKIKQVKAEVEAKTTTADYSALIGKVLNIDDEEFGDYNPTEKSIVEDKDDKVIAPFEKADETEDKTTDAGVVDNKAPLVIIQGNNPALIQIGSSYSDLGAKVTDNISNNLGVVVGGDVVDTSEKGSYFVTYTATDEAGNVATATREVIIYDYGVVPEVEVVEEIVPEPEPEPVVEEVLPVEEEIVSEPEPVIEEVATTTEGVVPAVEEVIATTTEETVVSGVTVSVVDVATEAVSAVAEGGKKVGKKVKDTAETIIETTTAVVDATVEATAIVSETIIETTTATVDQVSNAVETIAEEVSAMIKAIHFMELIGNIRSALQASIVNVSSILQASISTAGDGTGDVIGATGQFFEAIAGGVVKVVDDTVGAVAQFFKVTADNTVGIVGDTGHNVTQFFKRIADGMVGVASLVFDGSRSILQANMSAVSDEISSSMEIVGRFSKTMAESVVEIVDDIVNSVTVVSKQTGELVFLVSETAMEKIIGFGGQMIDTSGSILKKAWQKVGLGTIVSKVSDRMSSNISDYDDFGLAEETEFSEYQKENFTSFIFRQIINTPKIIINKIINITTGLTATVSNYSKTIGSDLEIISEQIDQKINETDLSPVGIVQIIGDTITGAISNVFGFIKNHRP